MIAISDHLGELAALPVSIVLGTALFALLVWRLRASSRLTLARTTVAAALSVYAGGVIGNTIFPIYLIQRVGDAPRELYVGHRGLLGSVPKRLTSPS